MKITVGPNEVTITKSKEFLLDVLLTYAGLLLVWVLIETRPPLGG